MHNNINVNEEVVYIGASDRRLALFENMYPLKNGVSYNSYLIKDQKTALLDTVDASVSERFLENLAYALDGRALDYIVVNHMEPDHCAALAQVMEHYPQATIVANPQTQKIIGQFFEMSVSYITVKEGDTLNLGKHILSFVMAPMVHWPEVMVTYDLTDKILFSADAFGSFGALSGNIFATKKDMEEKALDESRRYYTNIVGKYGPQVQALLNKAADLDIKMICPLHGPIWKDNIAWYIDKYEKWSSYTPEDKVVMIAYASVYGGTENAADILAAELVKQGVDNVVMYDVSVTHLSELIAEAFRCSHIVFASPTYNTGIFTKMETLLLDLVAHNLQNRSVSLIENGSWAPTSGKQMKDIINQMKKMTIVGDTLTIRSRLKEEQYSAIQGLAKEIAKTSWAES